MEGDLDRTDASSLRRISVSHIGGLAKEFWKCRPTRMYASLLVVSASLYCLFLVTLMNWKPGVGALVQGSPVTLIFLCVSAAVTGSQSLPQPDKFTVALRSFFFFSGALTLFAGAWLVMADVGCRSIGSFRGKTVSFVAASLLWLVLVFAFTRHVSF